MTGLSAADYNDDVFAGRNAAEQAIVTGGVFRPVLGDSAVAGLHTPAIADGRNATLRALTDAFAGRRRSDRPEIAHYRRIASALLPHTNNATRAYVAAALSQCDHAPSDILDMLCDEDIGIAKLILRDSQSVSDRKLVAVAWEGTSEHVNHLVQRADLPRAAIDALLNRLDPQIDLALFKHHMSNLSLDQITTLASREDFSTASAEAFIDNHTLSSAQLAELFWLTGPEMRLVIVADFAAHGLERQATISSATGTLAGKAARALVTLAREKRYDDLAAAFSRISDIDRLTSVRIIGDKGGEALCLVGRAMDLPRDTMEDLLSAFGHGRRGTLKPLMELFDAMPTTSAHAMLEHWCPQAPVRERKELPVKFDSTVVRQVRSEAGTGRPATVERDSTQQRKSA
ncbi:MAG: DUF2336 domain-containing protein [Pseudomonadota bacterium]